MRYDRIFFGVLIFCLGAITTTRAQEQSNYYMFPIKPGERNSLSGTMGELRSNHFHAGLDIRTEGRIGLPVHAAADGYISRIAVSTGGYGNAVYIQHPNGTTTVYAHLDRFTGPQADFVREMQYRQRSFDINLYFDAGDFPVKQGDVIAYSGNSGSSGGPHVHFDLRDANQDLLNPLSYGFDEIKDHTPPVAISLAVKSLTKSARVDGQFGRFDYTPVRRGNNFYIDQAIPASGKIGLELYAYDLLDNSRFRCGIKEIVVKVGDEESFKLDVSTFSFAEQRNILQHMDYKTMKTTGRRYHKLYIDDGNFLRFYETNKDGGRLTIQDGTEYPVSITMRDTYGNESSLAFKIIGKNNNGALPDALAVDEGFELMDNTLKINVSYASAEKVDPVGLRASAERLIAPSYVAGGKDAAYLWDMRDAIPQIIRIGETLHEMPYRTLISPKAAQNYSDDHITLNFPKNALFDTLYLTTAYRLDTAKQAEYFSFGDPFIPLRNRISVKVKPGTTYEKPDKLAAYEVDENNNTSYAGGEWEGDGFAFTTRDFGTYTLMEDLEKPTITALTLNQNSLRFRVSDKLSGIASINCYVNGEWVLMNYDYKRDLIWSEKKDESIKFSGEVKLVVTDNVNNEEIFTTKIN